MTTAADIDRLLRHLLSNHDLKILATPVPFELQAAELNLDIRGWQTSVYHPVFDAVVLRSKQHGVVLAQNTYLASFAYNLIAAWDHYYDGTDAWRCDVSHALGKALRMNFKKFLAEQILRRTHNLFGIAILLETLLYEEAIMYPVLAATRGDHLAADNRKHATREELTAIANATTGLVLNHELGHLVRDKVPDFRKRLLEELPPGVDGLATIWDRHDGLAEEFECDAFAVGMVIRALEEKLSRQEAYRLTILGFAIFAALHALDLSAQATAIDSPAEHEAPERDNYLDSMSGASFQIGPCPPLQTDRAYAVRLLVEMVADANGVDLYEPAGRFQLSKTFTQDLEAFLPTIIEGTDNRLRGKCEMIARALHGHSEGIDYLAWRSKSYSAPVL